MGLSFERSVESAMSEPLNPNLLDVLVCPRTRAKVVQVGNWLYSTDASDRRRYPIRDGIPIMLIEESEPVTEEEFQRATATRP
jgi:uncharacterized protein YbaR (Trm112 family)